MSLTEKQLETDIEASMLTDGGYSKGTAKYNPKTALYEDVLINFIQDTQPKMWHKFEIQNPGNTRMKFIMAFCTAVETNGLLSVLRKGFTYRGCSFKVCYFKPESELNQLDAEMYEKNVAECYRQWYYSSDTKNSVDLMIAVNGIPVFAFELKNQFTGQCIDNAKKQWMYDRDPRELCFRFNSRILAFFCIDQLVACMTTKLAGKNTYFLPFNQGSNGPGRDGGAGNPNNPNDYQTAYIWKEVFTKDSMLDILQKFLNLDTKKNLIFPRYHQLDVVRNIIADVKANGSGKNYLIQHSAGSGKSNSIAWTAFRLASLFDTNNKPIFSSIIIVTDRRNLDAQLQATVSGFDHVVGTIAAIDNRMTSADLRDAINAGVRIIVTTLQKFPVIYQEVDKVKGRCFGVIVDEAHSSQTGESAIKLKTALADTEDALKEYAEIEGKKEDEIDENDPIVREIINHGKHKNLSFFAFTATPKPETLELFGTQSTDGSGYKPFHIYSMRQAIEEGFILDVLQNYMTYDTCFKIAKNTTDNPLLKSSRAAKVIAKYQSLHAYNITQKSQIIVETFMDTTRHKIGGKGKMMVVTSSRAAAVKYVKEIRRYVEEKGYQLDVKSMVAFSGAIKDENGDDQTESSLNMRPDGTHISENQTAAEFHNNFNMIVVAEKFQTGFDEPLLHTMIVDKKLKGINAVQTLSRLNRTCVGKNDTFILDFINKVEEIQKAFQPFYQETILDGEVNVDLVYKVRDELREYKIYSDNDVISLASVYYDIAEKKAKSGKISAVLKPVVERYNDMEEDKRYNFRRNLRKFTRWYGFVSQVCRTFDEMLLKENAFCTNLLRLIPADPVEIIDLEDKLQLEYYQLKKSFEGQINLDKGTIAIQPSTKLGVKGKDEKKTLDEIIELVNEKYKGDFTDGDRVVVQDLHDRLIKNKKLKNVAKNNDAQMFSNSMFDSYFNDAAQDGYAEAQQSYTSLFEDHAKYSAIKSALASIIYKELTKQNKDVNYIT